MLPCCVGLTLRLSGRRWARKMSRSSIVGKTEDAPRILADESLLLDRGRWPKLVANFFVVATVVAVIPPPLPFSRALQIALGVAFAVYALYQIGLRHKLVYRPGTRVLEEHQGILFQTLPRARHPVGALQCVSIRTDYEIVSENWNRRLHNAVAAHTVELIPAQGAPGAVVHLLKTRDADEALYLGVRSANMLGLPLVLDRGSHEERTIPAATLDCKEEPPLTRGALRLAGVNFAYFLLFIVFGNSLEATLLLYACMAGLVFVHLVVFEIVPSAVDFAVGNPEGLGLGGRLLTVFVLMPLAVCILFGFTWVVGGGEMLMAVLAKANVYTLGDVIRYVMAERLWIDMVTLPILYVASARFAYDPAGDQPPFRLDSPIFGAMGYLILLMPAIVVHERLSTAYGTWSGVACAFLILVALKTGIDVTLRGRALRSRIRRDLRTNLELL